VTGSNGRLVDRHQLVRQAQRAATLRTIVESGPISRAHVAAELGLAKPTVSMLVADLERERLVRAVGRSSGSVGRSATLFRFDPRAGFVIGADLGGTKLRVALADLAGRIVAEDVVPTDERGGRSVADQIADTARSMATTARISWKRVRQVVVGAPGIIGQDGRHELAPNISGFDGIDLVHELTIRTERPGQVTNDVNLAAVGERWMGAAMGCDDFVILAIGTGVGAGIVSGGVLLTGSRGAAGEVAYLPIGGDPSRPAARRRGALELAASGSTLARGGRSAEELFAAAERGDHRAAAKVASEAELLAHAIVALASVVDPSLVVLAGGVGSNPALVAPVSAALDRISPWPIRIATTALGDRAGLLGAVSMGCDAAMADLYQGAPVAGASPRRASTRSHT